MKMSDMSSGSVAMILHAASLVILIAICCLQIYIIMCVGESTYKQEGVVNAIEKIREFQDIELNHDCSYSISGYEWLFKK